jgi:hypothetical protein
MIRTNLMARKIDHSLKKEEKKEEFLNERKILSKCQRKQIIYG